MKDNFCVMPKKAKIEDTIARFVTEHAAEIQNAKGIVKGVPVTIGVGVEGDRLVMVVSQVIGNELRILRSYSRLR